MEPYELNSLLAQLTRAHTRAEKARIARRLKDAQTERWFDAEHERAVQKAAHEAGISVPVWQPAAPRVGETWVLLYGDGSGHMAPLTVHARPLQLPAPELKDELERALAGLHATLARARRRMPHRTHATQVEIGAGRVVGASLGLAACAGWMSRALGVAVPPTVVATAQVAENGELLAVEHVAAKLAALRQRLPHVEKVIVSAKQLEIGDPHGFQLVRCETLSEALEVFDLSTARLPANVSSAQYERDLAELKLLEHESLGSEAWIQHAQRAHEVACALSSFDDDGLREKGAEAAVHGAMFALHGGDPGFAEALLAHVAPRDLPPMLVALRAVVMASKSIDLSSSAAVSEAREAVRLAEGLSSREQREVLGRAYGTLGRALMHTDAFEEALPWLQQGASFHEQFARREHARSLTYVAQCLRTLGRAEECLAVVRVALAQPETAEKSRAYLRLEEGRALLMLGNAPEALDAFAYVVDQQGNDCDYPRLSGLRGTAAAHFAMGQTEAAGLWLARSQKIVETQTLRAILRDVAAMAVGDVIARDGGAAGPGLWELWLGRFPEYSTLERVLWRTRTYVY